MDRKQKRDFEGLRRTSGAVENQLFDDFANGEMDRKTFLQRGTLFGLSLSALGTALVGLGEAPVAHARRATAGASAARRLQAAILPLPSFIEPHKAADGGTAATFGGELPHPRDAESEDGTGTRNSVDAERRRVAVDVHASS